VSLSTKNRLKDEIFGVGFSPMKILLWRKKEEAMWVSSVFFTSLF